jgi:hypothetical protein
MHSSWRAGREQSRPATRFTLHVNNLMFACSVTCALRVLALPQKTTSTLPKDISPLGASSELFGLPTD